MIEESIESVLKRAEDPIWLVKTTRQYYRETFNTKGDVIKLKLPYLEESLKTKGNGGGIGPHQQGKHRCRDNYSSILTGKSLRKS